MNQRTSWASVAVVEDDPAVCKLLVDWLEEQAYRVHVFEDGESFTAELKQLLPDAVLLDIGLPGMDGFEVLKRLKADHGEVPVIMLTGREEPDTVVSAMRGGAFEYLVKPISQTRLLTTVLNAVGHRALTDRVRELEVQVEGSFGGMVGTSSPMLALFSQMRRVAATDVNVLIRGETGSGKELVARALHRSGRRSSSAFIAVNCAAVPESLQETELFGHERGAFTGAIGRRVGLLEQADGGTLFLDEVGELSPALQAKLLRVLEERSFQRVGGREEIRSDFRLVVATNKDLAARVREGEFREDLYYRLAVFELSVPPLRERGDDILLLAHAMARDLGSSIRGETCEILPETAAVLRAYAWPGNVRELENVIQRTLVGSSGRQIHPWSLPPALLGLGSEARPTSIDVPTSDPELEGSSEALWDRLLTGLKLDEVERRAAHAAVRRNAGNISRAARELGVTRATLYRKLGTPGP